ncbi:MotE family protein [Paenibacillus protaetiae]|uniref:MgtE protein n=1 Tax=Paenibacillus protaetiae TaxID=2509456 RepID=A0A4P6ERR5_9BACL|nr:MgtE protein [Paenibacillus protaetiae]QAY65602.1 MgtE protein [Paenibacillus protaetiae]
MTDLETEKQGYSVLERIMFFVTPILFTLVLLGVLLTLFNFDMRNKMLEIGDSIPLLKEVLPEPQTKAEGHTGGSDDQTRSANLSKQVTQLQAELTDKSKELEQANEAKTAQDQRIADLQAENDQLKLTAESAKDEEYEANVKELANVYAKMMPSKAAPILESMNVDEMALVLGAMAPNNRARVLEKMNPQVAAEVSLKLKDAVTSKDLDIKALQAQLKDAENKPSSATQSAAAIPSTLDDAQLKSTFSTMDPKSAGTLLIKMAAVSPSKVLRILKAVDDSTRSSILAEMSSQDDKVTADLMAQLMAGK